MFPIAGEQVEPAGDVNHPTGASRENNHSNVTQRDEPSNKNSFIILAKKVQMYTQRI